MNFLAHAYLSFGKPDILVGNLIADMIKGQRQIESLPISVQQGVRLHRLIDEYTDQHPVTIEAKEVFVKSAGRYKSPFLDVSYDHFLALDTLNEPQDGWSDFALKCYAVLEQYTPVLPSKFQSMYLYMRSENWLYNYRHQWMIKRSFDRLQRRASFLADDANVFADFEAHYNQIRESYNVFFPDLKDFVLQTIK